MNHTDGVLAPVTAVRTPTATSSAAATRYTQSRMFPDLAAVAANTKAAMPHIAKPSASHSCVMIQRLSLLIAPNEATTRRVGITCTSPQVATTAAAT